MSKLSPFWISSSENIANNCEAEIFFIGAVDLRDW
jgi:hypothetical protein